MEVQVYCSSFSTITVDEDHGHLRTVDIDRQTKAVICILKACLRTAYAVEGRLMVSLRVERGRRTTRPPSPSPSLSLFLAGVVSGALPGVATITKPQYRAGP